MLTLSLEHAMGWVQQQRQEEHQQEGLGRTGTAMSRTTYREPTTSDALGDIGVMCNHTWDSINPLCKAHKGFSQSQDDIHSTASL